MIAGKTLLDYTNLFSPYNYKNNDKIIYKYFKEKYGKKKRKSCFRLKKKLNMRLSLRRNKT